MTRYLVIEKRSPATFRTHVIRVEIGTGRWTALPRVYRTKREALAKVKSRHTTVCGKEPRS